MIDPFIYVANPARVLFGSGTLDQLAAEAERLAMKRILVLSTSAQASEAEQALAQLGSLASGHFADAVMHTPVEVTETAMERVRDLAIDGVVSIGGGSSIGIGKALAVRTGIPHIAVPTTYAGSEMTPILGETRAGVKTTRSDPAILPQTVIYDVDLSLSLPTALSGTSGINAIAHAVEALYARERNPIIAMMAIEGIGALVEALPRIVANPVDRDARARALYGAWLCGTCLGAVGMALHHKLCHVLGGSFDLPHAETHAIILPHALAYNAPAVPETMARLAAVLGPDPALALQQLAIAVDAPRGLRDLGMPEEGIDAATESAMASPYWNPRPLETVTLRALLARAWAGEKPAL